MRKNPVLGPENIRGQAGRVRLTSGIDVGIGERLVDVSVVRRQENKAAGKIVISSCAAAAVIEAGVGSRARGIYRKRNFVDHGIGIGFHLRCRGNGAVPGGIGPRQTPHLVCRLLLEKKKSSMMSEYRPPSSPSTV